MEKVRLLYPRPVDVIATANRFETFLARGKRSLLAVPLPLLRCALSARLVHQPHTRQIYRSLSLGFLARTWLVFNVFCRFYGRRPPSNSGIVLAYGQKPRLHRILQNQKASETMRKTTKPLARPSSSKSPTKQKLAPAAVHADSTPNGRVVSEEERACGQYFIVKDIDRKKAEDGIDMTGPLTFFSSDSQRGEEEMSKEQEPVLHGTASSPGAQRPGR